MTDCRLSHGTAYGIPCNRIRIFEIGEPANGREGGGEERISENLLLFVLPAVCCSPSALCLSHSRAERGAEGEEINNMHLVGLP